jgi:cysteine desulfurase
MSHGGIYLDHAATTPVRPEVLEAMTPYFTARFGNPSSVHRYGREARVALDEARERVARCLGAHADEVIFTSCGTESDNLALVGAWRAQRRKGRGAIATTPIEHKAVLAVAHHLATEGAIERVIPVDADGTVDDAAYDALLGPDMGLVSVMWVNNEIGVVQDVPALAARAKAAGALFHTDGVQAFGKVAVDARTQPFDLLALSGHKIGAPKGIGALYLRRGTPLEPLMHGGAQDRGRRPGTENVAMAVGLAVAAELAVAEREVETTRLARLRGVLETALLARVPDAVIHGRGAVQRAPHIVSVSVPGTDSESMLMALDLQGIAASGGSACQSGSVTPSHVLSAIGVRDDIAAALVRLSMGHETTEQDVLRAVEVFATLANKARGVTVAVAS